jgi:hypothetical protein
VRAECHKCRCSSGTVSDQHTVSNCVVPVLLNSNDTSMDIQDDYTNDSGSTSEVVCDSWFLYRVAQEAMVHG